MKTRPFLVAPLLLAGAVAGLAAQPVNPTGTMLGIQGTAFTLNGKPAFLLGFSYYGALGAQPQAVRRDLDSAQRLGFNWLRVWATWNAFEQNLSAVDAEGTPREPHLENLKWLVSECDRRGLVVDVTLSRGELLSNFAAHRRAVETVVDALKAHRNWYIDLANEHDVHDARYVSDTELKLLRELVRSLDSSRLVTASCGGHDLTAGEVREALLTIRLDFLTPHRPRTAQSPRETESQTRALRSVMHQLGCAAPIQYQEPFRRGYARWEPQAEDFLNDLKGAVSGGAAGWCFHNGQQGNMPDKQPRRSFDLRKRPLFEQLDDIEQKVIQQAAAEIRDWHEPR